MTDAHIAIRVRELLSRASQKFSAGDAQGGAIALREAIHLDPNNEKLKASLINLKNETEGAHGLLGLCRDYIASGDAKLGQNAMQASSQQWVPEADVAAALAALLASGKALPLRDRIVANLLSHRKGISYVVDRLQKNGVTDGFGELWSVGGNTIEVLVTTSLNPIVWPSPNAHSAALRGIFTLLLTKVVEPGTGELDIAMKSIARLAASNSGSVISTIDDGAFAAILSCLDLNRSAALRSQATLIVAKSLEVNPKLQEPLVQYIVSRAQSGEGSNLTAAFSVACAIFPVVPAVAVALFLKAGFVEQLVRIADTTKSTGLRHVCLDLLSAACAHKECRDAVAQTSVSMLETILTDPVSGDDLAKASLIMSKITASASVDERPSPHTSSVDLVEKLHAMLLQKNDDDTTTQTSIEGLAYTSTQPHIAHHLSISPTFLPDLLSLLSQPGTAPTTLFGGLTILTNLTRYPPSLSAEQHRLAELHALASVRTRTHTTSPRERGPDPLADDAHAAARCRRAIDAGVAPLLVGISRCATPTLQALIATLSLALTRAPETRGRLVQQGLLDVLLRLCGAAAAAAPSSPPTTASTTTTTRDAAYALARLLIPLDPSLIFHSHSPTARSRSLSTTIRALHGLLVAASPNPSPSSPPTSPSLTPTSDSEHAAHAFEALRALTNLASLSSRARAHIDQLAFPAIEALLWAPPGGSARVQQAAVECVCNLVCAGDDGDDVLTAKFTAPTDPAAGSRLTLLYALTGSPAPGTRRAAAGALAGLLSCNAGPAAFLNVGGGVAGVLAWLADEEETEGMRERGLAVLVALLVGTEGDVGRRAREMVKNAGGMEMLSALLRSGDGGQEEAQACLDALGAA